MILGIDISTYLEGVRFGAKYFKDGKPYDPTCGFIENGVEYSRIRLWNDPYSPDKKPYLGGTCDLDNFFDLALMLQPKGYKTVLDFHYSDFWADPGKQTIPKAWQGKTLPELCDAVYSYTKAVLLACRERSIDLSHIQVGNEITNGMLWPIGRLTENEDSKRGNYDALCELIKAGVQACRELYPEAELILHLERSHDSAVYDEFFTEMEAHNVDYDIIGASYYPYWHGTFEQFFANMDLCKKFNKKRMVMELGYAFTLEGYSLNGGEKIRLVIDEDNSRFFNFKPEYPISPEGQAAFIRDFLQQAQEHGLDGVFYWEPLWVPQKGICWASNEGQAYIGESGKSTQNEWANQCLFDYDGNALPAFDGFRVF
ncbi:MAG: glycosyl hydrolase 53 family protein [Clostridia bacterium]|nr:glycosyl hydrolase 53 family protein [Clostridia bacterium]